MNSYFLKTYKGLLTLAFLSVLTSCSDTISNLFAGESEIEKGEKVLFTTMVPDAVAVTRSAYSEWKAKVDAYKPVNTEYSFDIKMFRKGSSDVVGSSRYVPDAANLVQGAPLSSYDGTLVEDEGETGLYWQDNVNEWGFKAATVSSESIEADQSDQQKWLFQDKLVGYSYLPVWEGDIDGDGHAKDDFNAINYRTSKQWYKDNQTAQQLSGLMVEGTDKEAFKKIPLYMQHKRSWITIVLKAGDGVTREQLAYENSENTIKTTIYSYDASDNKFAITETWRNKDTVNYVNDKNGPALDGASTTRYDAIVEPYNYYGKNNGNNVIASIDLSNQKFTFAAANDFMYEDAQLGDAKSLNHMNGYNIEPGKHLTITATLSRASRMVLITAWVEDWNETVTTTVCDDYGNKEEPEVITSKEQLIAFLEGEKNKAGYVGIISGTELDLDEGGDWITKYDLRATLNIAGAKLKTSKRLFKDIAVSGSIINGIVEVKDDVTVDEVIAQTNNGTIEHIILKTASDKSTSKATVAGYVKDNHGTIYQCSSNLAVEGTSGFVGGIAATSCYASEDNRTIMPVIDKCTVNARVDGGEGVRGGGIVGSAEGRVTNCTFDYGVTLLQTLKSVIVGGKEERAFNSIFQTAATETKAYNNSWPTKSTNPVPVNNPGSDQLNANVAVSKYDNVIDCQSELAELMKAAYNVNNSYRLSADFTITNEGDNGWKYGNKTNNVATFDNNGNMRFSLYGNGKTITLDGTKTVERKYASETTTSVTAPMLFSNVMGKIYDLTIDLKQDVISEPSKNNNGIYNAEDAIAPLAYTLYGAEALLSNVRVISSAGKCVESATPSGLVVWSMNDATIENCIVNIPVKMWMPENVGSQSKHYAGGVVACAARTTVNQCQYQSELSGATPSASAGKNLYYGGIVGGTVTKDIDSYKENPKLVLNDNSSWFTTSIDVTNVTCGSIIGYAAYAESDATSTVKSGMAEGNEGNWWWPSSKGTGTVASTTTEEQAIGKRNSITPTKK